MNETKMKGLIRVQKMKQENEKLREFKRKTLELLKEIQWSGPLSLISEIRKCPCCDAEKNDRDEHFCYCKLEELLNEGKS